MDEDKNAPVNWSDPWPEVAAPSGVSCREFGLAGHGRLVWGEGHPAAPLMIVLDNPGAREDKAGRPYLCGTRQTLRQALAEARWLAAEVYITFLVKCRPLKKYDRPQAWATGLHYLRRQVAKKQPAVLALLGDVVVRVVSGDEGNSVRRSRGKTLHLLGRDAVVGYHPLAARRRPALYPLLVEDLARARTLLATAASRHGR